MANRRISGNTYNGAVIDTNPGVSGYWTIGVQASKHKVGAMFASICGIFAGTVTLQFRPNGIPSWTNFDSFTDTTRQIIEDYTDCEWRIGVTEGNLASGTVRVLIDYHDGEAR